MLLKLKTEKETLWVKFEVKLVSIRKTTVDIQTMKPVLTKVSTHLHGNSWIYFQYDENVERNASGTTTILFIMTQRKQT